MKTIQEIVELAEIMIEEPVLEEWIAWGWVKPIEKRRTYYFEDIDIARIQLIYELHHKMMIERDAMPIVLSLLDQLYSTRARMNKLISAIEQQPRNVQADIFSLLRGDDDE